MIVQPLYAEKDPFQPLGEDEEILGPEVPYLNVIRALIYLMNYARLDLAFTVNLLVRYSFTLIKKKTLG